MAGGGFTTDAVGNERADQYKGRVTPYVIIACIVAAIGGSLFGYDVGISGGVTSMDDFLEQFFPEVYMQKKHAHENNYCKYDSQSLAAFTSSLYIAGLIASLVASPVTRKYGRRISIIIGGVSFLIGSIMNASAMNLTMLILGRVMLGIGIGFGNQAIPLYLSEMAPTHLRGGLNMMFQVATTLGIFSANMVNFGTQNIRPWGWRLSLGLAGVPALLMMIGGIFLPDTPNSLIERGLKDKGRKLLEKIRGTSDVDAEFEDMVDAMLFQSMGFGGHASLYSSALTGGVLACSTFLSIATVDRLGRRVLLISGGLQMIVCQIIVAIILGLKLGENQPLSRGYSIMVVIVICLFVVAFGWSWGPLGWTIPSEIFPLEIRSAGQSITVAVNLLFTFIIAQAFLGLLCALKFGIFLFFASWIVIMTVFVMLFLPETKGIPIEEMAFMWKKHWFWKLILPEHDL
ncbi:unnamed protein product [Vicia faba]|uniref:Major facilitator superfamily (MFS) profile domain-containing protein n=1 Tax=Vicia faba TaxID=3906 RepID=A0AAV0YTF8_VICFA|nr:unnamed protein product [Vicia faba]